MQEIELRDAQATLSAVVGKFAMTGRELVVFWKGAVPPVRQSAGSKV